MSNRPENSMSWEIAVCEFNHSWTSVGYILRGPKQGTFVPIHHWGDIRDAQAHVMFLNRGLTRDKAKEMVMALIHEEVVCD
jgi:hypothetical protein